MTERQADGRTAGQASAGTALKRRGILAAAGAAVAAIVAKQTAQPVAADSGGGDQGFLALGSNPWYKAPSILSNTPAISSAPTVIQASPNFGLYSGQNGADIVLFEVDARTIAPGLGSNVNADGIYANASGTGNGIVSGSGSAGGLGVYGISFSAGGGAAGVRGDSRFAGDGVQGGGAGPGSGVVGQGGSSGGSGVVGAAGGTAIPPAGANVGVYGSGGIHTGVYGTSSSIGVYGLSSGSYGVVGGTTASGGYGGYFATSSNNSFGLRAEVQGAATGSYGLYATAPAGSKAAYFTGDVYINGSLTVADMTQKHGLLRGPDGAHHLLYTMEAPESWAEDFGTGTLTNGKATVTIDPLFASLVHTDDYHVFLTPHADTNGLHVTQRGPAGFEVAEHKGGTANLTFSYRVVARPKGGKVERLGKYAVPPEPPPAPPLPKVPEPTAAPPSVPLPKKP